ncbi:hypothetical protein GCM10009117_02120 [Gangjinia marincola]|uniref:Uncharacterized protein n=1 Tax=Gangjinia marincola TaxID=578463 RepID=A0ABN1MDC5_9FLAO
MNRVIVDYKKLTPQMLSFLVEKYPDGYGDKDIISFKNHHNELIEAVQLETPSCVYLVRVSKHLASAIETYGLDDDVDENYDTRVELPEDVEEE